MVNKQMHNFFIQTLSFYFCRYQMLREHKYERGISTNTERNAYIIFDAYSFIWLVCISNP